MIAPLLLALLALLPQAPTRPDGRPGHWHAHVDVSSDGKRVAVARFDGKIELLDPDQLLSLAALEPTLDAAPWALAFAPDGTRLAALDEDGALAVWELGGPEEAPGHATVSLHQALPPLVHLRGYGFGADLVWSPAGDRLALIDHRGTASLRQASGEAVASWEIGELYGFPQAAWTADGLFLLTARKSRVEVRDGETGELAPPTDSLRAIEATKPVVAIALHPTRPLLATGHTGSRANLWDPSTGELVQTHHQPDPIFDTDDNAVAGLAFSPDGSLLAFSTREGSHVVLVDVGSGARVWTSPYLGAHFFEPLQLSWSPDGSRVWYAFACRRDRLGSYAPRPAAGPDPLSLDGPLPRFGGSIGVTITQAAPLYAVHVFPRVELEAPGEGRR